MLAAVLVAAVLAALFAAAPASAACVLGRNGAVANGTVPEPSEGWSGRCYWYKKDSCCTVQPVGDAWTNARGDADCRVERDCRDMLALLACKDCSPNQEDFVQSDGKQHICKAFADDVWNACEASDIDDAFSTGCVKFRDLYETPKEFIEAQGNWVYDEDGKSPECFAAAPAGATVALALTFAATIAVALF